MKSGGKDPSVTYLFLSRTRLRHSRHTAEELLSWLTRVGRLCASRGQWARPSTPQRSVIFNVMVRRLRGLHPFITRRFRAWRACPHDLTYSSVQHARYLAMVRMFHSLLFDCTSRQRLA